MAQLKDLLVNGVSRLIGTTYGADVKLSGTISANKGIFNNQENKGSSTMPIYWLNGAPAEITSFEGKATTAGTADQVGHSLTIKLKTGSTEGTDLYTFNGSATKTLDIKQGSGIVLTAAAGSLTITNSASFSDPTALGEGLNFIDSISQTNGVITATKKTVQEASVSQSGVVNTSAQTFAGNKTFNNKIILGSIDATTANTTSYIQFGSYGVISANTSKAIVFAPDSSSISTSGIGFFNNVLRPISSNTTAKLGDTTGDFASAAIKKIYFGKTDTTGNYGSDSLPIYWNAGAPAEVDLTKLRTAMNLSSAMHFIGIASTEMEDGQVTNPSIVGKDSYTPATGDVVLAKDSASGNNEKVEFVYTGIWWELLGQDSSFALSEHVHGNITNDGKLGTASQIVVTDGSKVITTYAINPANIVTATSNTNVSVAGTTKTTYKYNQTAIFAPNGLIMGGTAAAAGLVTRGICGVTTPDNNTGAATKDNLYINYDGDNTYRSGRQLILQAGSAGTDYGNNVYQYAAVRGDAMKAWVEAKGYITSSAVTTAIAELDSTLPSGSSAGKTLTALTITDGKMTAATFTDIEITTSQISDYTPVQIERYI